MAKKILKQASDLVTKDKFGGFSFGDMLAIAVAKTVSERALSPIIGNGDWISGAWKFGGALALPMAGKMLGVNNQSSGVKGIAAKAIGWESAALAVDGAEDVARSLLALIMGGARNDADIRGVM